MLYMIIEDFGGNAVPIYRRFRDLGRMMPDGLTYVSSWVTPELQRCFQLMETDDPSLLEAWMERWRDLGRFEVVPVISSAEAAAKIAPRL